MSEKPKKINERAFRRCRLNTPVRLRIEGESNPFTATLNNFSKGGIGFATNYLLPQDTLIHIATPVTVPSGNIPLLSSDAQIVWTKQKPEIPENPLFELGCRWMAVDCDWCHVKVPFRQLQHTEDSVCLCRSCLEELENNLNGQLKDNIHRYLLGNVI